MMDDITESQPKVIGPGPTKRRASVPSVISLIVFVCVAIALLVTMTVAKRDVREGEQSVTRLRARIAELKQMELELDARREQHNHDRLVIFDLLQKCRVAEEIPNFTGMQVFVQRRGASGFALWVPAGNHQLRIDATITETKQALETDPPETDPPEMVEPKVEQVFWTIDLLPSTGYLIDIQSDRKGSPVTWTATANRSEFQTRTETVPSVGFESLGWSYSGSNLAAFPNQVGQSHFGIDYLVSAAKDPPGLQLYDLKLSGRDAEKNAIEITLQANLISDSPTRITAGQAQSVLIRQRPDLLAPYQGDGYYDLRTPDEP